MADQTPNTGGGSSTGGDARAGQDFIGRDQNISYTRPENLSVDEKLNALFRLVVGDKLYNIVGFVDTIADINRGLRAVVDEQHRATEERDSLGKKIQRNYENTEKKFTQQSEEIHKLYLISISLGAGLFAHLALLIYILYIYGRLV